MVLDNAREGAAFDVLHDNKGAISFFTYFIDRADVRVVQCGRSFCLSEQPFLGLLISEGFGRQHLDRHLAIEPDVLGQEYFSHSARTESLENAVMRNLAWKQTNYLGAIENIEYSEKAIELKRPGKNAECADAA